MECVRDLTDLATLITLRHPAPPPGRHRDHGAVCGDASAGESRVGLDRVTLRVRVRVAMRVPLMHL